MRRIFKFLLSLALVLAIVWLGLWWYAQGRMQSGFTDWTNQLAGQGWKVSYSGVTRGTSPLAAQLSVTNLSFSPPPDARGRTGTITLPSLGLRIDLLDPLTLHTDLPDRIGLDVGGEFDSVISFTTVALTEQLDPQALLNHAGTPYRSGAFNAAGVDILASQGSLLLLHIDGIASDFTLDPNAGATGTALATDESVSGVAVSPLMTHLLGIPFDGSLTSLALSMKLSGPPPAGMNGLGEQLQATNTAVQEKAVIQVAHEWAAAGGNGTLSLAAVIGPSTIHGKAALQFDPDLQPSGTADLTADHLDEFFGTITAAYPGLQGDVAQIEAQLSPYITASNPSGQALAMHVTYGKGEVSINGQNVAPLPPLDWTSLENPPPAPAQAPGDGSGAGQ
jgi:hypothetical protein